MPPNLYDLHAERGVLACAVYDGPTAASTAKIIGGSEDFFDEEIGRCWEKVLNGEGFEGCFDFGFWRQLLRDFPPCAVQQAEYWAGWVRELAERRNIFVFAWRLTQECGSGAFTADLLADRARARLGTTAAGLDTPMVVRAVGECRGTRVKIGDLEIMVRLDDLTSRSMAARMVAKTLMLPDAERRRIEWGLDSLAHAREEEDTK